MTEKMPFYDPGDYEEYSNKLEDLEKLIKKLRELEESDIKAESAIDKYMREAEYRNTPIDPEVLNELERRYTQIGSEILDVKERIEEIKKLHNNRGN